MFAKSKSRLENQSRHVFERRIVKFLNFFRLKDFRFQREACLELTYQRLVNTFLYRIYLPNLLFECYIQLIRRH